MKVLITGASGRLGRNLAQALEGRHEVVKLGRSSGDYQADITDYEKLAEIFSEHKPEAVIHLAGLLAKACASNPRLAERINVEATANLAKLSAKSGVRKFLFASTSAIYHQTKLAPTGEQQNITPQSVYGKTKLAAEQALEQAAKGSPTAFLSMRLFNIYGPDFEDSLVYQLMNSSKQKPVTLYGPNNFYRDYVHVWDVAKAFSQALETDLRAYQVINIGSGVATSNEELLKQLKATGRPLHYEIKKSRTSISWADIAKAESLLNFRPATKIKLN